MMDTPTPAAIYIRVSTTEQTYDNQKPALERFAELRGYRIVAEYAEEASAWREGKQEKLAQLMKDAEKQELDYVLVWALDRLTRGGSLRALLMMDRLGKLGIRVISLMEPFTEAPPAIADVLYSLYGWLAAEESRKISERTKAGMARKKAGGGGVGRRVGSKDTKKRNPEGYLLEQARRRIARAEKKKLAMTGSE